MNNVKYLIDYNELNKRISDIVGENLEINEENAKEKLKKLYHTKSIRMLKLNLALSKIDEIDEEYLDLLEFETDKETVFHSGSILFNVFNRDFELIEKENIKLFFELIFNNEIQQILENELPSLIKISDYFEEKNCKRVDVTKIIDAIFDLFYVIDIFKISEDKFFEEMNKELDKFLSEKRIDDCLNF